MTLKEWQDKYEKLEGQSSDSALLKIMYSPDEGYMKYAIEDNVFYVDDTCTINLPYFKRNAVRLALENDCKLIFFLSARNPAPYIRFMKSHLNVELSGNRNGKWYWAHEIILKGE